VKLLDLLCDYNSGIVDYRLRKMAKMAKAYDYVLDLGYAEQPNPYLQNPYIIGVDLEKVSVPANYQRVLSADVTKICDHFSERSVDAIICGELLEHLEKPVEFLKQCNKIIKNKGVIILSTPNPHYIMEIILTMFMIKKIFYSKDHVCLYPQRWLIRMLEIAGFKNVYVTGGGVKIPYLGTVPFFRTFGLYTILCAEK
jgi:SAM-dependent methyltransferase